MKLSREQRAVVESPEKRIVVIATPGSGKTFVLTERVRWLLRQGEDPSGMVCITFTNNAAEEMRQRLGEDYRDGMFIGTIHSYANLLLNMYGVDTSQILDKENFDELFELITKYPEAVVPINFLALDEAQDSNLQQFEFVFDLLEPEGFIAVGDPRQCQPAGTRITLKDYSKKNIEDVEVGDEILVYNSTDGRIQGGTAPNSINGVVEEKKERILTAEETIYTVKTKFRQSEYTAGHKCCAMLHRYKEYNHILYLIENEQGYFRIGTSQFRNSNSIPWKAKWQAEKYIKGWVLDVFKTAQEAIVEEAKISFLYGIPQTTWQIDKTSYSQEQVDYIFNIPDLKERAIKCLKHFDKYLEYPFSELGDNVHYAGNAFNKVYACNLLPHNMSLKELDRTIKSRMKTIEIKSISKRNGEGEAVYSLKVSPCESYVADGLVTFNSIYKFAGGNPKLLGSLARRDDVTTYELTNNYRSKDQIISYSNWILTRMKNVNSAPVVGVRSGAGIVENIYDKDFLNMIIEDGNYGDWAILCRTNNRVYSIISELKKHGIPAITFRQAQGSLEDLRDKIKQNAVKVLTVHSAKGLEFPKVVVAEQFWKSEEDKRIVYVAATRAEDELYWIKKRR